MASLSALFVEALPDVAGPASGGAELDDTLSAIVDAAHAAWPGLSVPDDAFVRYLAERAPRDVTPIAGLEALASADLFIACACARGDAGSAAQFVARMLAPAVESAVRRVGGGERVHDDALQVLSQQLLVPREDGTRGIERFSGRGAMHAWLRVVATREVMRLHRGASKDVPQNDEALLDALTFHEDPELAIVADRYRTDVREALHEAMTRLPPREKALLAFQLIDGLSIDRIGAIHAVHRSTASRWLADARDQLLVEVRVALGKRLGGAASGEVDSLLRLVKSGIDLSLERVLRGE